MKKMILVVVLAGGFTGCAYFRPGHGDDYDAGGAMDTGGTVNRAPTGITSGTDAGAGGTGADSLPK